MNYHLAIFGQYVNIMPMQEGKFFQRIQFPRWQLIILVVV